MFIFISWYCLNCSLEIFWLFIVLWEENDQSFYFWQKKYFLQPFVFSQIKVVYLHRNNHLPTKYNDSIMNIRQKLYSVILSLGCSCLTANAAVVQNFMNDDNTTVQHYNPTAENLASRKDFQDAKFGIFLHWGL